MRTTGEEDLEEIRKMSQDEFPNDPALQQVHIAGQIISRKAKLQGLSFLEYIRSLREQADDAYRKHGT